MERVKPKNVKNLAFKGGSVKGIAYLGCLKQLVKEKVDLSKVERVIGTSAGSITALLVALNIYEDIDELRGYCNQDLTQFLDTGDESMKNRIISFADSSIPKKALTGSSALSDYSVCFRNDRLGFADGDNFLAWIEKIILEKTDIPVCTFLELSECEIQNFKDLYIVAFDLKTGKEIIFSKKDTPDAIVSDAIRSSISIPFIFQPHKFYCKRNDSRPRFIPEDMKDHDLIDGGVQLNYPVKIFDDLGIPPGEILGFYLTSEERKLSFEQKVPAKEYNFEKEDKSGNEDEMLYKNMCKKFGDTDNYARAIYNSVVHQSKAHQDYEKDNDRTIYINHLNISSLKFDLTLQEKGQLIEQGKIAVNEYFRPESKIQSLSREYSENTNQSRKCRIV